MILAFDLSTAVLGYAYTRDKVLIQSNALDLKKYKDLQDKFAILDSFIQSLDYCTSFAIEAPLLFMPGKSSANTISKLFAINQFAQYTMKKRFTDIDIHVIHSATARAKLKKDYSLPKTPDKDTVRQLMEEHYTLTTKYKEDQADAIALLRCLL